VLLCSSLVPYVGVVIMYGPLAVGSSPCLYNSVVYHSVYVDYRVQQFYRIRDT
jgi:hypothetical protein